MNTFLILLGVVTILYILSTFVRYALEEYNGLQKRYSTVLRELRTVQEDMYDDQVHYEKTLAITRSQLDVLYNNVKPAVTLTNVHVTAYAPMDNQSGICADENPNTTSTMVHPGWGYVAVNPNIIPYGTVLYIPGYGTAIAADTGYAVRAYNGIQIDVYMDTYDQAIQWGVQTLDVIVLDTLKKESWVGLRLIKEEANE